MSSPRMERISKIVWLVNGVILLGLGLWALGYLAYDKFHEEREDTGASVAPAAGERGAAVDTVTRRVRFGTPNTVKRSAYRFVMVRPSQEYAPVAGGYFSTSGREPMGPNVNVIFLPPGDGPGHLLLDRPASIARYTVPDTLQSWFTYAIALDDTDGNGRLDDGDVTALYVSDVDGQRLSRVLPPEWRSLEYTTNPDGHSLTVTAVRADQAGRGNRVAARGEEHAFIYDIPTRTLKPYAAFDALAAQAAAALKQAPAR